MKELYPASTSPAKTSQQEIPPVDTRKLLQNHHVLLIQEKAELVANMPKKFLVPLRIISSISDIPLSRNRRFIGN
jgi:hypothetical protein